jgi:hypothetical protein
VRGIEVCGGSGGSIRLAATLGSRGRLGPAEGIAKREIVKYLFVLPHTAKRLLEHTFDLGVKARVALRCLASDRRLDIARSGDAWAARHLSPWPGKMPFLRWCLADKTVARS